MTDARQSYLVVNQSMTAVGRITDPLLSSMTERHHFRLPPISFKPLVPVTAAALGDPSEGVIILLGQGLPNRAQMRLARGCVRSGRRTLLGWPQEHALEVIDAERIASLARHRLALLISYRLRSLFARRQARHSAALDTAGLAQSAAAGSIAKTAALVENEAANLVARFDDRIAALKHLSEDLGGRVDAHLVGAAIHVRSVISDSTLEPFSPAVLEAIHAASTSLADMRAAALDLGERFASDLPTLRRIEARSAELHDDAVQATPAVHVAQSGSDQPYGEGDLGSVETFLNRLVNDPKPAALAPDAVPTKDGRFPGTGVYLRLDFWSPLSSGGSYGHTCFQAKALSETTHDLVAVMANRFDLLDGLGVRQVAVPARSAAGLEANLLGMNHHYSDRLGMMFEALRPAYIFERAVLGNAVGAWASRRFGIPYIVEYNGSEISMRRSFMNSRYEHENLLLLAEDAAFRQATLISVVSDQVAADVARRGIPENRILVNPNAVDLRTYCPGTASEGARIRKELGLAADQTVVGFIGTFGDWHGIDVLCGAMKQIFDGDPSIRLLLIGDGRRKPEVHEAVQRGGFADRVIDAGRVPQARGAELLKACDILVSPHSSNMIDSPFFGSPTKLFEYMAMGAGIIASDLEQIGHVLAPALRPSDFAIGAPAVTDQRAVLCRPGDVKDFAAGVLALVRAPAVRAALGRNAREAAKRYYTWDQHVRNLWLRLSGKSEEGYAIDRHKRPS